MPLVEETFGFIQEAFMSVGGLRLQAIYFIVPISFVSCLKNELLQLLPLQSDDGSCAFLLEFILQFKVASFTTVKRACPHLL